MPLNSTKKSQNARKNPFLVSVAMRKNLANPSWSNKSSTSFESQSPHPVARIFQSCVAVGEAASMAGIRLLSRLRRRPGLLRRRGDAHSHEEKAESFAQRVEHAHCSFAFPDCRFLSVERRAAPNKSESIGLLPLRSTHLARVSPVARLPPAVLPIERRLRRAPVSAQLYRAGSPQLRAEAAYRHWPAAS
jgi:hypothetical protein